jgi:hypothetical protein
MLIHNLVPRHIFEDEPQKSFSLIERGPHFYTRQIRFGLATCQWKSGVTEMPVWICTGFRRS